MFFPLYVTIDVLFNFGLDLSIKLQGAHNKFPDFFFIWALLLIVLT